MVHASFSNVTTVSDGTAQGMALDNEDCVFYIQVYPSDEFVQQYYTNTPMVITLSVAIVFVFVIVMFFVYDRLVERRQNLLLAKATRTQQIVASFFPKHVRDQILNEDVDAKKASRLLNGKKGEGDIEEGEVDANAFNGAPIADLFPDVGSTLFYLICCF